MPVHLGQLSVLPFNRTSPKEDSLSMNSLRITFGSKYEMLKSVEALKKDGYSSKRDRCTCKLLDIYYRGN